MRGRPGGRRVVGRSTTLILANTIVGAGLGFAALKVLTVETGVHADRLLGQLAFAFGITGLFLVALDLGMGSAHIKRVSEGRDLATLTGSFARVKVALAGMFVLAMTSAAFTAARLGILQDAPPLAVVLVSVYAAFLGLRYIFTATFEGTGEFAKSQLTVLAENLVRAPLFMLVGFAFAAVVLGTGPLVGVIDPSSEVARIVAIGSAELLAASYALAGFLSFVFAWALFRRGYPMGRLDPAVVRDYWAYGRHIFLASAIATVYMSVDKVIITAFWEPSNTGQYYAAQRFSDLITTVPFAVYTVLFPALSGIYARGDKDEARRAIEAALRHLSMVVVPVVVYTMVLAAPLLSLVLTGVFQQAVPTLRILALYALVYALMYPYASVLNALGRPDVTARAAILATGLNLVLNLALVPPPSRALGLPTAGLAEVGAAAATLAAVLVQFLYMRRHVFRLEGRVPEGHLARHALAGLAMGAVLWLLTPAPEAAAWYVMLGLLVLGGALYAAVLVLLREFTAHDLKLYLSVLNPAAMARYLTEEVQSRGPERGAPPEPPRP